MTERTYVEAIREGIRQEMERDERVMILGEDVGAKGGVFGVTDGLFKQFGGDRVLDAPLAESCIVGVGIGLALYGMRPLAEIQFQDFIMPAVDQIVSEAAKMRFRSNDDWSVPMVIRAPFGGGVHGALYHSQSIEAMFCGIPGLKVVVPSSPYDAKGLITAALRDPDPVMYFEHKRAYRSLKGDVPDEQYVVPIGSAQVVRDGDRATVFTYGYMVSQVLDVAGALARESGAEIQVVDLRTLRPLDSETIVAAARKTGKVLIVQEANLAVSISSEVSAIIGEHAFDALDAPIMRLGGPEVPAMPYSPPLEHAYLVTPEKIRSALDTLVAY